MGGQCGCQTFQFARLQFWLNRMISRRGRRGGSPFGTRIFRNGDNGCMLDVGTELTPLETTHSFSPFVYQLCSQNALRCRVGIWNLVCIPPFVCPCRKTPLSGPTLWLAWRSRSPLLVMAVVASSSAKIDRSWPQKCFTRKSGCG